MEFEWCHMDRFLHPYMLAINAICFAHNMHVWLDFGVLLGFEREGHLMEWDYDIDFALATDEVAKLLQLRPHFENMGFEFYTRNEFIWHKVSGETFYIIDPVVRLYFSPSSLIKFHVEFYEYFEISVTDARKKGYILPHDYQNIHENDQPFINSQLKEKSEIIAHSNSATIAEDSDSDSNILICANFENTCLLKEKVFPLRIWSKKPFGIDWYVPNDIEYVLQQMYGNAWRVPIIKGWKAVVCYQKWNPSTLFNLQCLSAVWFMILIFSIYNNIQNDEKEKAHQEIREEMREMIELKNMNDNKLLRIRDDQTFMDKNEELMVGNDEQTNAMNAFENEKREREFLVKRSNKYF